MAFVPRVVLWVAVLAVVGLADPDPALSLLLIALAGVVTIVSDSRFAAERALEAAGVPSREAWVPLAMLVVLLLFDLVDVDRIGDVIVHDGPVIVFILSFALVAEGLRRSGFIHFLAYRLAERGGANTTRLTLYLFLLSSVLTYLTSNDIVVLTMTPIVMSVAHQARIANAKLLLLSQFIAANTVSMGLLIGSPTNLILGRALGIRFVEYFFLMLVPSALALMATFVFVTLVNRFVERRGGRGGRVVRALVGSWTFSPRYSPPRFTQYRSFTGDMRYWVAVFGLSVALLVVGTATNVGLLFAGVTIAVVAVVSLWFRSPHRTATGGDRFVGRTVRILPLGIVFFGLTYFVIADAIADTPFVQGDVNEVVSDEGSSHTPVASWSSILASGGLVNTMNDLPASALAGKVLERADFDTPFDRALVTQGTLTGLNIATYVTPVGALAGIIWFDILRKERARHLVEPGPGAGRARVAFEVEIPRRRDLVVYGTATFLAMTAVLGATNFGVVSLADLLLGPPGGPTEFGDWPAHMVVTGACLAVALGVVVSFRRTMAVAGVVLAHLGDLFVVLTRLRLWASRHRLLAGAVIAGLIFVGGGLLLYWVESFHVREYGGPSRFDDLGEFSTWLVVFVSSGFENDRFPRSLLGNVLAAALALGSIAALVVLVRLSTRPTDLNLRLKLARGEIPDDRIVVVNGAMENLGLVRTLVAASSRFVTVATRDPRLEARLGLRRHDRVAVVAYEGDPSDLVADLRLDEARELVLLSRSVADDFDNLALLSVLDTLTDGGGAEGSAGRAQTLPAVVLQVYEQGLPRLVDRRLSGDLLAAVARPPFEQVVRSFLVADAAGRLDDLRRLYEQPLVERAPDAGLDRHVRIEGAALRLRVGPAPVDGGRDPSDAGVVGVQLDVGGRGVWRTFAARRVDEVLRPLTGTVLASSQSDPAPAPAHGPPEVHDDPDVHVEDRPRALVHLVGSDGFAQRCAVDLVAAGVGEVHLVVRRDEPLMPGVEATDGLTVVRCDGELAAAASVLAGQGGDRAVVVVEGSGDGAFDTERLLERLSIARLHAAEVDPAEVPALYVCCRGEERARRVRNFVVDKVIDVTWVEASYFAVFAAVYFDLVREHEELADWPADRQLALANRVASRLCHLAVWRPGDGGSALAARASSALPPGLLPLGVAPEPPVDATARGGSAARVLRCRVEPDDDSAPPVVVVDVTAPTAGTAPVALGPRDLLAAVRYL